MNRPARVAPLPTRGGIARAFDEIAEDFDATRTGPWPETLVFVESLRPGMRVLDLGCGNGRNLAVLAGSGRAVVGLDASGGLLARAAAKVRGAGLVRADAVSLPFRDGTFDAIHCVAAIHHLPSEAERLACLWESVRVLRLGGLLLITAWALEQDRFRGIEGPDAFVPWRRSDGRSVPRFYHLFRGGELDRLLEKAGLAVERAWREGDNHAALARKRNSER